MGAIVVMRLLGILVYGIFELLEKERVRLERGQKRLLLPIISIVLISSIKTFKESKTYHKALDEFLNLR